MDKMKKIKDLQQGDNIQGTNGERLEIISNQNGVIFYYNTKKAIFETRNLTQNAKNGDFVWLW